MFLNESIEAVELPLQQPVIDVNSYHAFSHAILLTNESLSLPWLFSNYIHLFGVPEFDKGNFIHFASSSWFHEMPSSYVSVLHTDYLQSWFDDPLQMFIECLQKRQYLAIALDEYYIPGMHVYQRFHHVHHMLIHGYDPLKREFIVAGFFSDPPVFTIGRRVSHEQLKQAFVHAGPVKQRISQTLEIVQFPYQDANTRPFFELHLPYIAGSLEEYLQAKPLTEKNPARANYWFGVRVYDLLVRFLELELEQGKPIIHMKALQTLVNHKRWMVRRIQYLLEGQWIDDLELAPMAEQLLKKTVILHHWCVKYRIKQDPGSLHKAIQGACELKRSETNFLEAFLGALHRSIKK